LHEKVARRTAGEFLRRLIAAVPCKVHTVLTDNGTHFTTPGNTSSAAPDIKAALDAGEPVWAHAFEYACGHVTSSGSRPIVYRRPARTFVLPAPRVPDGLTISPSPFREQPDKKAPMISYRIMGKSKE